MQEVALALQDIAAQEGGPLSPYGSCNTDVSGQGEDGYVRFEVPPSLHVSGLGWLDQAGKPNGKAKAAAGGSQGRRLQIGACIAWCQLKVCPDGHRVFEQSLQPLLCPQELREIV